jgi:hypothetical protein
MKRTTATTDNSPAACEKSLRPFLRFLLDRHHEQGGVTELRLGPSPEQPAYRGYFKPKDLGKAVSLLLPEPGAKTKGTHPRIGDTTVSYNPHPVRPRLYSRSPAEFSRGKPAGTSDLLAFSLLAVRVEPYRRFCGRASELEQAELVAQDLVKELNDLGISVLQVHAGDWLDLLIPTKPYTDIWQARLNAEKLRRLLYLDFSNDAVLVGGNDSAFAIQPLLLPGSVLVQDASAPDQPPHCVHLLGAFKIPNEVDLFGLLAEPLASLPGQEQPDDLPDELEDPAPPAARKPARKKKKGRVAVNADDAAAEPDAETPPASKQASAPAVEPATAQDDEGGDDPDAAQDADAEAQAEPDDEVDDVAGPAISTPPPPRPAPAASWNQPTAAKVFAGVLERAGVTFREEEKGGERVFQFEDCPLYAATDDEEMPACAVAVGADGSFEVRCCHSAHFRWKDLKLVIGWAEHAKDVIRQLGVPSRAVPYRANDKGLFFLLRFKKRVQRIPLSNFNARILRDIEESDGVEVRHTFEVEACLNGQTTRFTLPAAQFRAMTWPLDFLGAQAVVHPDGSKPRLLAAIQLLSGQVPRTEVFTHTGWRLRGEEQVYLHAGGAIGKDGEVPGVQVAVPEQLSRYRLPVPPEGDALRDAVRASLRLLEVAPDAVTVPLSGGIWRAVVAPTDFGLHLVGKSGSGKTAVAALHQQHWGAELDAQHLPASWLSTANANELLAFYAKDAVLTVDDFVPIDGKAGTARQHQEADRLFRGQGNSTGRNRLGADSTLQPPRPPRGMVVSTGEATPAGYSLQARLLLLKLAPGMLNWELITACQQDAAQGLYAAGLAGYLRWLAPRLDQVRQAMPTRVAELRAQATADDMHKRTPGIVANLFFGLELFSEFAVAAKAMTKKQAASFRERCWKALGEAAAAQGEGQAHGDPAQCFLEALQTALAAGKAHVAGANGGPPDMPQAWGWRAEGKTWSPCGKRVGWVDCPALYLDPKMALAVAQDAAPDEKALKVGEKTLNKRLSDAEHLVQIDAKRDRLVVRKTLEGKVREVLHLPASLLVAQGPPPAPEPGPLPPDPPAPPAPPVEPPAPPLPAPTANETLVPLPEPVALPAAAAG